MFFFIIQVVVGLLYVNLLEWLTHRFVLHGLGTKKASFFSFHWHRHHKTCRKNDFADRDYTDPFKWETTGKELVGLGLLSALHLPILFVYPVLFCALFAGAALYYFLHSRSHMYPVWGRKWLPWHYDHHQGKNQNANWCVTYPFWDYVLGTRQKYEYDENGRCIGRKVENPRQK